MPKPQAVPRKPTSSPPMAGPTSAPASWRLVPFSALAPTSRCGGTSSGVIAIAAGKNMASPIPNTKAMQISPSRLIWSVATSTATTPTAAPRATSDASITSRRGTRSTSTPPASVKSTAGSRRAARTYESPAALCSRRSVSIARVTVKMPSPSWETAWPDHSNAKSRCFSGSRYRLEVIPAAGGGRRAGAAGPPRHRQGRPGESWR